MEYLLIFLLYLTYKIGRPYRFIIEYITTYNCLSILFLTIQPQSFLSNFFYQNLIVFFINFDYQNSTQTVES